MKKVVFKIFVVMIFFIIVTPTYAQFNIKKAIGGAAKAVKAFTLTDEQMAEYVKESVDWMDEHNPVLPEDNPYVQRLRKLTVGITDADGIPLNFKVYHVVDPADNRRKIAQIHLFDEHRSRLLADIRLQIFDNTDLPRLFVRHADADICVRIGKRKAPHDAHAVVGLIPDLQGDKAPLRPGKHRIVAGYIAKPQHGVGLRLHLLKVKILVGSFKFLNPHIYFPPIPDP